MTLIFGVSNILVCVTILKGDIAMGRVKGVTGVRNPFRRIPGRRWWWRLSIGGEIKNKNSIFYRVFTYGSPTDFVRKPFGEFGFWLDFSCGRNLK